MYSSGPVHRSSPPSIPIALCQVNPTVGDIVGNRELASDYALRARAAGAAIAVFPELVLSGYPPEDLLFQPHFLQAVGRELESLASVFDRDGQIGIVGFPELGDDGAVYNSLAVLARRSVVAVYRKMLLPNYGVFDERRYFEPGAAAALIDVGGGLLVGISVCEDIWQPEPVIGREVAAGAGAIINISASPYHRGKAAERERMLSALAADFGVAIAYCNTVGGQDELVFDGASVVIDAGGDVIARAAQFSEELLVCHLPIADAAAGVRVTTDHSDPDQGGRAETIFHSPETLGGAAIGEQQPSGDCSIASPLAPLEAELYAALRIGLRDYVDKNGFPGVLIGLSGGIDSALVACIAVDALSPERVEVVTMPSRFNSPQTLADAHALAANLEIPCREIAIDAIMVAFDDALSDRFAERARDHTEENLQARIRGALLMAISNKFGPLVLVTGNKSEMAVGYTTLYGDMAGGFAVLKDVPKTIVYALARYRNQIGDQVGPIPQSVIDRPPSAELSVGQSDERSLGPYATLDAVIEAYIEQNLDPATIARSGIDRSEVDRIVGLIDRAEYKRRQAPPGVKTTVRAFGRDRRLPITVRRTGS